MPSRVSKGDIFIDIKIKVSSLTILRMYTERKFVLNWKPKRKRIIIKTIFFESKNMFFTFKKMTFKFMNNVFRIKK